MSIMRVVVQRVKKANVKVKDEIVGEINTGLLLLVAIHKDDILGVEEKMADKILSLRIFNDREDKMNQSVLDVEGEILAVSQFTLFANIKKGNRPGFTDSARPEKALPMFNSFVKYIREKGIIIQTGNFGKTMEVKLINDGPVTLILDI
jgi:D-tyrosyl-tRNA(Tyr) deacylase